MSNQVINKGDWYISYLPPGASVGGISAFGADEGGDETAICVGGKFYILNGDHREDFNKDSLEEAMQHFRNNPSLHSSWSNEEEVDEE
jgi:hypothetical protein